MPKNLASLIIGAIDEFDRICNLQRILEICSEEFHNPDDNASERVQLLISLYQSDMELRLDELRVCLKKIQQLAIGRPKEDS